MSEAQVQQGFAGSVSYGRYTEEIVSYFVSLGVLGEGLICPVLAGEVDPGAGLKIVNDQLQVEIDRLRATLPHGE